MAVLVVTSRPAVPSVVAQRHLAALGDLPREAVTGRYDAATTAALARFQARHGLQAHGVADRATAGALLAAAAPGGSPAAGGPRHG